MDEDDTISILAELDNESETGNLTKEHRQSLWAAYYLSHQIYQFRNNHPNSVILNLGNDNGVMKMMGQLCNEMGLDAKKSNLVKLFDNTQSVIDKLGKSPFHSPAIRLLKLSRDYHERKKRDRLLDFDDLLMVSYTFLRENRDTAVYDWIQVDEVQDLNPLQLAIIDLLKAPGDRTVVYLGDEQQSIFSFIGARRATMEQLKERCGKNIHRLEKNYRSPSYLLKMTNDYARTNLGINPDFLPKPANEIEERDGDMTLITLRDNIKAIRKAASLAASTGKNERTAIIVANNRDADTVSEYLDTVPHFKISGTDFFSSRPMQLVIGHLNILSGTENPLVWAKFLKALGINGSVGKIRKAIVKLLQNRISPADFLKYRTGCMTQLFADRLRNATLVVFDTETTGLDTTSDDIVQIAALKIKNNEIIDRLNIFLETDKEIPAKLGDIDNPLIKEYAASPHFGRKEGLMKFIEFSRGTTLVGHNVEFDYNILDENLKRDAGFHNLKDEIPERFDTLRLCQILFPGLFSYKLKDLLTAFKLDGENSHLADDDIVATKSLMEHIGNCLTPEVLDNQKEILKAASQFRKKIHTLYGEIWEKGIDNLYTPSAPNALSDEIERTCRIFIENGMITGDLRKLNYVRRFITIRSANKGNNLRQQLDRMLIELNTFREADLCEGDIVEENIFVTTVHKAKGLEFDNVIVFGAVDGTYPFFASQTEEDKMEDARKLYVALSRARRRLTVISYSHYITENQYGLRSFEKKISPFISKVSRYFKTNSNKS